MHGPEMACKRMADGGYQPQNKNRMFNGAARAAPLSR